MLCFIIRFCLFLTFNMYITVSIQLHFFRVSIVWAALCCCCCCRSIRLLMMVCKYFLAGFFLLSYSLALPRAHKLASLYITSTPKIIFSNKHTSELWNGNYSVQSQVKIIRIKSTINLTPSNNDLIRAGGNWIIFFRFFVCLWRTMVKGQETL